MVARGRTLLALPTEVHPIEPQPLQRGSPVAHAVCAGEHAHIAAWLGVLVGYWSVSAKPKPTNTPRRRGARGFCPSRSLQGAPH